MRAVRVVEAAGPGKGEALEREIRVLRGAMFDHAILSINAVPDRIFERAAREGWKRRSYESLRAVSRVAPLSLPLWAWLAREDAVRFRLEEFLSDVDGLSGALRQYGPGLLGYAVWIVLFASASACWFAVWASLNLLLRARPALTSDVARIFKGLPRPEIFASVAVLAGFVVPIACGVGIAAAAVFWIALSTAYLRRGEIVIGGTAILMLLGVFLCGGFLETIHPIAGKARQGGWLGGEGYYSRDGSDSDAAGQGLLTGPQWERMARSARARAEMQGGDLKAAESLWTGLIEEGGDPADAYNNRGIVRVRLGRPREGLADFEAAADRDPSGGRAQWNAYQLYLQEFRLEQAARIQPVAWAGIRGLVPFDYRAGEMTHGELVASPLRVGDVWRNLLTVREEWFREAGVSEFRDLFFRPVPGGWVPAFLAAGLAWMAL
ncbi:MAG: tetratricopeptide repeat protein, partial [bacterium]|nr:tetratricopeptide repeat protein [bacterium]